MKLIACIDENLGLGYKNKLLYNNPEDMKLFKKLTTKCGVVIMGRNTFNSIGKVLPDRTNIILTSCPLQNIAKDVKENEHVVICRDIESLFVYLNKNNLLDKACVIGGASIYKQLIDYCDEAYITYITKVPGSKLKLPKADSFFPDIFSMSNWRLLCARDLGTNDSYIYEYIIYNNICPKTIEI